MVARLAKERGHEIVETPHEADVCIDFSSASGVVEHIREACEASVPIVIGTTGWETDIPVVQTLVEKSGIAALYAPNFSLGVALFRKLLKEARAQLTDYEIAGIEWHHQQKKDAPSGTACAIAKELDMPTPFSSVRCGSVVGKHSVFFDSLGDTITLTHEAKNREGFALGALKAAEWIIDQKGWLTLDDMLYSADYTVR
ncbi:MAG: 4-hydroxy-tetrahydrodipicolinate reductase [Chlamydiales bacterium]|nr:4-hydroxy-tetrahydrodipicolinate reductase [Chlamydiales bacterium]